MILADPKRPTRVSVSDSATPQLRSRIQIRSDRTVSIAELNTGTFRPEEANGKSGIFARLAAIADRRVAAHSGAKILFHDAVHFRRLQQSERVDVND